ncbi:hypothetical protein BDB00DRAFT_845142 [Zychaea mexicana]|uniref:uncharacterized protein n=1 Tax=Zychaea mexicana TaxID=64656 RepID=UPI0022FE7D4E|nr:uncharacterized protein BDB00DRAFT_845142 [Zychaea mexicana]KAI9489092.1 hypothetical protein BDB00DRAFT_845142 [Zychaea mexicana]
MNETIGVLCGTFLDVLMMGFTTVSLYTRSSKIQDHPRKIKKTRAITTTTNTTRMPSSSYPLTPLLLLLLFYIVLKKHPTTGSSITLVARQDSMWTDIESFTSLFMHECHISCTISLIHEAGIFSAPRAQSRMRRAYITL